MTLRVVSACQARRIDMVESSTIRDAWHKLLCSLFEKETTCDAQIVAWNESVTSGHQGIDHYYN